MVRLSGAPYLGAYDSRFEELRERIWRDLEPAIQQLRSSRTPARPIFDQGLLDGEMERIVSDLEQVVANFAAMCEGSATFAQIRGELQRYGLITDAIERGTTAGGGRDEPYMQHSIIRRIEPETPAAPLESGNEALVIASRPQKPTRKCGCWIFIIVLLVVTAVVRIVLWRVFWNDYDDSRMR
jgi:hypothetical protein